LVGLVVKENRVCKRLRWGIHRPYEVRGTRLPFPPTCWQMELHNKCLWSRR